jgi:type III restriction enzyme
MYRPDFIVHLDDGHGRGDPLKLIIEVKGEQDELDLTKMATAQDVWVTAVNNDGRFGRWAFLQLNDQPHNAEDKIRAFLAAQRTAAHAA